MRWKFKTFMTGDLTSIINKLLYKMGILLSDRYIFTSQNQPLIEPYPLNQVTATYFINDEEQFHVCSDECGWCAFIVYNENYEGYVFNC